MNLPIVFKNIAGQASKRSPELLTAASVAGLIGTVVFAIRASRRATLIVDQFREEYAPENPPKKEVLKKLGLVYLPTIAMGGITIACIISANRISAKRNAVLAGLYSASEYALNEYQKKVVQTIGESKERSVRSEIAKDRILNNPVSENQVIMTGGGETLCYDSWSGRYFKGDPEKIRRAENEINRQVLLDMWVSVNEFYYQLGLAPTKSGEHVGWDVDHMLEITFSSHLADERTPCLVIDYKVGPKRY